MIPQVQQTVPERLQRRERQLARYMARPQRHRLLHGYPLAAAMPYADARVLKRDPVSALKHPPASPLLVGVLPHPFCNPKVMGCGFCTFPHERYSRLKCAALVEGVIREIADRVTAEPQLERRKIAGLYFGGGTANLTPPKPFRRLAHTLNQTFDVSSAEVTLEGVPA